ncbi:MAG: PorV/PorQ family protein [Balneolaceae bacterium]|nr:PorV/PorQ family protein [Balneolaceae bacterium]
MITSSNTRISLLLMVLIGAVETAFSQSSGLQFLNIGPNSRALSLGEAVTALPMGGSSIYSNPANLAQDSTSSLTADYTLWIADQKISHVAVNLKRNEQRAIAFGLLNSTTDNFEARTRPGPADGTFSVNYLSLAGAYAQTFGNISIGGAAHFIREEFLINKASGYSLNAGIAARWLDDRLRTGVSLLSLGKMNELRDEPTELPSNLRAGVAAELFEFTPPKNRDLPMLISIYADYISLFEEETGTADENSFNLGLSVNVAGLVDIRGGYKTGRTDRKFGLGIGVDTQSISFNYSLIPFETGFGTAHSIGMEYYF